MDWSNDPGPPFGGEIPRRFLLGEHMKELSVFIDESGNFGAYGKSSQYYIVTLILHNQSIDITENIARLNTAVSHTDFGTNHSIHTGPLIRRETDYINLDLDQRRYLFNCIFNFTRTTNIKYKSMMVNKKDLNNQFDLNARVSKQLSAFIKQNIKFFLDFDKIVLYYDNGQTELTNILVSVFNSLLSNVDVRKVLPKDYKLFQAADLICTLELLNIKRESNSLSNSELIFFKSARDLNKNYLKPILKKQFNN